MRAEEFFAFARERHAIYLRRKNGDPEPWTDDPILAMYRFTNIFRELDRTTVWFRENVRDRLGASYTPEQQVLGTILFRTLNRIETGESIFNQLFLFSDRHTPVGWEYIEGATSISDLESMMRVGCRPPWVTGSYIVKTPDGMDKLRGALWIVEEARRRLPATLAYQVPGGDLQGLHIALCGYPYVGGFTGYEIVSDLRWLPILQDAPDVMTWAHAGPGARRGANRVMGWDKTQPLTQTRALAIMGELLAMSQDPHYWPQDWATWEMREVEHTLCEWDKYERVRLGEGRPRGRFR